MRFEVLGPLRAVGADGRPLALASAAQRRLVSMLVLRAGSVVPAGVLEEHLELSGGALRTAISRLRRVVGDVLVTAPPGYELRTDDVDVIEFERLLGTGSRADLESALALWRGDAYAEFAEEAWAVTETQRLATLRSGAAEDLVDLMLDAQEWTVAIATLEPLIERDPFRDRPRGQLMRALAGCGRRTDALRAFQAYRSYLADEVGTEPSAAIVALDREIALGDTPHAAAPFDAPGVFFMSDIVGSTRLWLASPEAMGADLIVHDEIVRRAISEHGGVTIATAGDSFTAVFDEATDAADAAVAVQRSLATVGWRSPSGIRVRVAVHVGVAQRRGDGWYGAPLNETARMMAAGHGGQIVVSEPVAQLLLDRELVDLGEHRLRDLDGLRRLYQVTAPDLRREFPSLRSLGMYVTTLPHQRTALIGRETLVSEIRGRLIDHPLVTLIGPGGVGKTRSAVEAAGRELGTFDDGVFFVDLTTATADAEVVGAFVTAVKATVPPDGVAEDALAHHLDGRHTLLVVDNCEHVVDGAAGTIDTLLSRVDGIRVLATSREALRVRGEQCVPVPSLDVEGPESPGVRLLVERAVAAGAGDVVASDAPAVVEIARRLDGLPLAIELAAAQLVSLTPSQILGHLGDRFRLLTRGHRPAPARQQTLVGAIAWSYELLAPVEQHAFRSLSICAGPFTLGTVSRLLSVDDLEAALVVDALVAKSLIAPITFDNEGMGFRYLESLREFGRRELAETGELEPARVALETALLPTRGLRADWRDLVNEYILAGDVAIVIEDVTRRDAAVHALEAGRLDAAALILSSCAFRDYPGELDVTLERVGRLAQRRDDLDPLAWRAATATKLVLERLTRRYETCFMTAIGMLDALDADDPARDWFDLWRCALTTAIDPAAGLAEIDKVLDGIRDRAQEPHDWTYSQLLVNQATGLAALRRLDDALAASYDGYAWAGVGRESRDQALALACWLTYLATDRADDTLPALAAKQGQHLGLAELCAAPGALCSEGSVEDRAARVVAAARRRPPTDVTTPFLLAFAWLAVEEGDPEHAAELAAVAELYDASTMIGLIYVLARVRGWSDAAWAGEREAATAEYLHPDHETAARGGPAALAAEIEAWEHRLATRAAKAS